MRHLSFQRFALCLGFVFSAAMASKVYSAESRVTDAEIVIGQSLTLQGGKDAFGVSVGQGIKLHLDAVNAEGGVHGRKVVLRVMDDEGKGPVAEINARKLIDDGAFMLFGSVGGAATASVMKVARERKVPFFGQLAGTPALRRPYQDLVFPVRAEHRDEFLAMMRWGKSLGLTTVAFLYVDTEVGHQHLENVKIAAKGLAMSVTLPLAVKPETTEAQIDDMVKSLRETNPGLFIHNGPAKVFQAIVKKAKAAGLRTAFAGVNQGSYEIAKALGPLAQGMVFTQVVPSPWERKREITREYQDLARRATTSPEFSYGALEGYVTAKALVMALRLSGKQPTRASFVKALENVNLDLGGMSARYAPGEHEGSRFVDLSMVTRDGKFMH